MSEVRWPLPESWQWALAGDIAKIVGGGTPSSKNEGNFAENGIPWITPADLTGYSRSHISRGRRDLSEQGFAGSGAQLIPAGSVLFSSRAPIGYCVIASNDVSTNQGFKSLVLDGDIDPGYVRYYLLSAKEYAESKASGTTFMELSGARVAELAVPIAPLPEQRRIVAKVDGLTARTARARKELDRIPTLIARYKQRLLALAFSGELTAGWRTTNLDALPTSGDTLAGIESDKLQFSAKAMEAFEERKLAGVKATKPRQLSMPEPLTAEQLTSLWPLPEKWQWLQIGTFCFVTKLAGFEYTDYVKYDPSGDLKVLKAENAGPNGFRTTAYSMIQSQTVAHLERSFLTGGELLVVFVGAGVGQVAIVPENERFFLGPNIGMARPYSKSISSRYLELFLRSDEGKKLLLISSKAVAQPSISMGAIRATPVAIPSPEEQAEIVRRIESAFSWLDRMAADHAAAARLLPKLDAAILAKAFRGKLVPQDPNDEPASALLVRIKAERAAGTKVKRGKQVRKTRASKDFQIMAKNLEQALAEAGGWISAEDAFQKCGIGAAATTAEIEKIYAELRKLDKAGRIESAPVNDDQGRKLHDLLRLKAA
jgi:type I restriction enzyme, S subunit